jgi:hypothetical protein
MNKVPMRVSLSFIFLALIGLTSCDKDDTDPIQPYEVPATYTFDGANYSSSTNRIKMAVELNSYLGSGSSTILSQEKANQLFTNTNSPFTNPDLNASGVNLADKTAEAIVFKGFMDQHVANSNAHNTPASDGSTGFIPRGSGKILVGPQGLEFNQAVAKGMMGSLFFKEVMAILSTIPTADNTTQTDGATAMQRSWDEAFGYLGIPADYDTARTYVNTDPNRPLLWGGYLAERGKPIQAGGILFEAFRKGRAAIGAKDYVVRDQQIKIIQETWEKLAAISALAYVTIPQASTSVGNLGTQFHALSEGYGFVLGLKYRPAGSKLTEANFQKLVEILSTNFYTLVNEPGFAKLKEAETILKTTYNL